MADRGENVRHTPSPPFRRLRFTCQCKGGTGHQDLAPEHLGLLLTSFEATLPMLAAPHQGQRDTAHAPCRPNPTRRNEAVLVARNVRKSRASEAAMGRTRRQTSTHLAASGAPPLFGLQPCLLGALRQVADPLLEDGAEFRRTGRQRDATEQREAPDQSWLIRHYPQRRIGAGDDAGRCASRGSEAEPGHEFIARQQAGDRREVRCERKETSPPPLSGSGRFLVEHGIVRPLARELDGLRATIATPPLAASVPSLCGHGTDAPAGILGKQSVDDFSLRGHFLNLS